MFDESWLHSKPGNIKKDCGRDDKYHLLNKPGFRG